MAGAEARAEKPSGTLPSFHRILLATDFSERSAAAVPYARRLAEYYEARILVAHAMPGEETSDGETETEGEAEAGRALAETRVREFLAQNSLGEISYETAVGEGPVWEVFAPLVEEKNVDLIVLGTHGWSGVGKLLLGSVAQRIFSVAPCPVVSVSPRAHRAWGANGTLSRILYATGFSQASLRALPYALSVAKVSGAELLLLHAPAASEESSGEITQGYHQHLNALIPAEHKKWCKSDTLVVAGEAERVILEAAERTSADLVVMGAHSVGGSLATFQIPLSTAYRVVAHAPCPVLRVRS